MTDRHRVLIRTALGIVLLAVITHTRADPDLWGHVRFGRDIVSDATIPRLDQYAFTSDREWINHEWLAESAMYVAYAVGRGPGLVVLKLLVALGMLALIWNGLKRQQVDAGARDLLIALAVVGTGGWMPLYRGPRSIWLSRDASDAAPGASQVTVRGRRCFPGP